MVFAARQTKDMSFQEKGEALKCVFVNVFMYSRKMKFCVANSNTSVELLSKY